VFSNSLSKTSFRLFLQNPTSLPKNASPQNQFGNALAKAVKNYIRKQASRLLQRSQLGVAPGARQSKSLSITFSLANNLAALYLYTL